MRILILGGDGFVGRHVSRVLSPEHEVYRGTFMEDAPDGLHYVDLSKKDTIAAILKEVKPEIIINCAGIVENSEKAELNYIFTSNLLDEVLASGIKVKRIIITGSAAEYGQVDPSNIPVKETAPLAADSLYGKSKLKETSTALAFGQEHDLSVVVARLFNPIGQGMHPRFLIQRIGAQVEEVRSGTKEAIELSRLDARRDYIDIRDVAEAFKVLALSSPHDTVYNIGSGESTSNGELVDLILRFSGLERPPKVVETSAEPEQLVAIQADVSRLQNEFGWKPVHPIAETVKEILNATK